MSTALANIEFSSSIVDASEMTIINDIVAQCDAEIALMNQVNDFIMQGNRMSMINRLQVLNKIPNIEQHSKTQGRIEPVNLQHVKENIWAEYWQKVTDMTNVLRVMPAKRREEWRDQFILGQGLKQSNRSWGPKEIMGYVGVPEFSTTTVVPTMIALLNDRHKYLAERVHGVFTALSPAHKTNKHYGFSEKLIIAGCIDNYWDDSVSTNHKKEDHIDDLRVLLHFFAHKEFTTFNRTSEMMSAVYRSNDRECGVWTNVDGNLMRVKMFKNGNVHFEIHPDVAWKLNEVLATMMPAAIPSNVRQAPKTAAPKEFGYIVKTISSSVRSSLRDGRYSKTNDAWMFSDGIMNKTLLEERDRVLKILGGVWARGWRFPYDAKPALDLIVSMGVIPDTKSHQFYPTPDIIASYVAKIVGHDEGHSVLEPSAGSGSLLAHLLHDKSRIDCVDISPLFASLLNVKGYNAQQADFLTWATANKDKSYDRIVMNPPYSEGRAKAHTIAALTLLKPTGVAVAVLPAGYKPSEWIGEEFVCVKSGEDFTGEFEETGISVAVFVFKRLLGK